MKCQSSLFSLVVESMNKTGPIHVKTVLLLSFFEIKWIPFPVSACYEHDDVPISMPLDRPAFVLSVFLAFYWQFTKTFYWQFTKIMLDI